MLEILTAQRDVFNLPQTCLSFPYFRLADISAALSLAHVKDSSLDGRASLPDWPREEIYCFSHMLINMQKVMKNRRNPSSAATSQLCPCQNNCFLWSKNIYEVPPVGFEGPYGVTKSRHSEGPKNETALESFEQHAFHCLDNVISTSTFHKHFEITRCQRIRLKIFTKFCKIVVKFCRMKWPHRGYTRWQSRR